MLGGGGGSNSVRSLQQDAELSGEDGPEELRGFRKAAPEGAPKAMMQKRAHAKGPAGVAPKAAELKVFKSGSVEGRVPPLASNLRKQKSLTNLSFLTDSEKKMQLYEPKWSDDMAKAAKGFGGRSLKGGKETPPLMSKNLSRSEHSLFQAKLAPAAGNRPPPPPLAPLPSNLGKPSRIPRGPYAEVKPLSKAPDAGSGESAKSDDELLSGKGGKAAPQKQQPPPPPPAGQPAAGKGAPSEEKAFLKVDPELVVTVLGDLEQLLFSQMLGESLRSAPPADACLAAALLGEGSRATRGGGVKGASRAGRPACARCRLWEGTPRLAAALQQRCTC